MSAVDKVSFKLLSFSNAEGRCFLVHGIPDGEDFALVMEDMTACLADAPSRMTGSESLLIANKMRYLEQRNALISLTGIEVDPAGDPSSAFDRIIEISAKTLSASSVCILRFSHDEGATRCVRIYPPLPDWIGQEELALDAGALSTGELIVLDRASEGGGSCADFTTALVAPVYLGNVVEYAIRFDHTGYRRKWTPDEKTFAAAVANHVSLAIESSERIGAKKSLVESHQRFKSVAAATSDIIWEWNIATDLIRWESGAERLLGQGVERHEIPFRRWVEMVHPEDRDRVVSHLLTAVQSGHSVQWSAEYRLLTSSGEVLDVEDRGEILRDSEGRALRMVGGLLDLTERKAEQLELSRTHRALQMLSSCNELLIREADEQILLQNVCRLAVELGGYRAAWVSYASDDGMIARMAHGGDEPDDLWEIDGSWKSPVGPAGEAIRTGKVIFCESSDGRFPLWMSAARQRSYEAAICLPLSGNGHSMGVVVLLSDRGGPAGMDEMKLLTRMADDLAFGIENIRQRIERQKAQDMVVRVAQAVSSEVGDAFFDSLVFNMVEALGASGGQIGKYLPDIDSVQTLSLVLDGARLENLTYHLDGTPCQQVVSGQARIFADRVQELFPEDQLLIDHGVVAYAGIALTDSNHKVSGILAVFFRKPLMDVELIESTLRIFAARAASELERQQSDARLRQQASMLDHARDAIVVRDLNHAITYWNHSAELLYGWSADEVLGKSEADLLYQEQSLFDLAFAKTLQDGSWIGELHHVGKNRRNLVIESRWTLIRDAQATPQAILVINTDISDHKNLEQQFLRAQRLESIGRLAGGIAHDLNNALAPILLATELLKMQTDEPKSVELLDSIAGSARRGAEMVGQVQTFARGDEGRRIRLQPQPLIEQVRDLLKDTLPDAVHLQVDVSENVWSVWGDPAQLHQVVYHLCINARDAVGDSGTIRVKAYNVEVSEALAAANLESTQGPHLCIEVSDNGEGIPRQIIDKIFDPFFTTRAQGKGTGLGLSTSLAIVRRHGGFIRVQSEPGVRTVMQVYLPADPVLDVSVRSDEEPQFQKGNGEMVLIVDDEESLRRLTQQTLDAFGYRTRVAMDGEQAIAIFSKHCNEINLVLTDMMMPGMDGSQLIRRLMEIDPEVCVVATSGISSQDQVASGCGSAVKAFLPKPCTTENLLTCLRNVFQPLF